MMSASTEPRFPDELRRLVEVVYDHARGMWRHRWWALASAWLIALTSWVAIISLPNEYEATTRVYVDTKNVLRPLLRGLSVEPDLMSDVSVMTRVMMSRPSLERVARATDLDLRMRTQIETEALLASLAQRIGINRNSEDIYSISFSDTNRETALRVVSAFLNAFVENSLGNNQEDSAEAEKTLEEQIKSYEQRLAEADERLKAFKQKHVGMMPDDRGDYYQQLQTAMSDLADVQYRLQVTQRKRDALQRQIVGEEPVLGVLSETGDRSITSQSGQIVALENKLSELRIQFTDKHPEVIRTQSLLDDLRRQRDEELARSPAMAFAGSTLDTNPVYQNIKIQLANAEVDIAGYRAELEQKQAAVDRLQEMVDVIPEVEADLSKLNRDYGVVKGRYEAMLERWETLQTSQRIQSSTDPIQFRVIDPPFAASAPVGPNRPLLLALALVAALGGGMGVAFLLDLFYPVVQSVQRLSRETSLPVVGSVSLCLAPFDFAIRRRRLLLFIGCTTALVCASVVIILVADPVSEFARGLL